MRHEVFISYSQPDRDCAFSLVERLEATGIRVWIAPRDVSPSADWAAEIIDAIAASRVMVLVFSSSSNESGQVRREVERAVHKGVRVLPFRIEDVLPSKSLEYFLSSQHWMDAFPPPFSAHIDRLCAYLRAALEPQPLASLPGAASPPATVAETRADAPAGERAPDPAQLRALETELARVIGPLAGHLVRRATLAGGGLQQIAVRLAADIDREQDRGRFLEACRRIGRTQG